MEKNHHSKRRSKVNSKAVQTRELTQSAQILREIRESAKHPKTLRATENLKATCDLFASEKSEISVLRVGRYCERMNGGPKLQSIRNNLRFADYVKARATEQPAGARKTRVEVAKIRSGLSHVDGYVETLEHELAARKSEIKALRQVLAKSGPFNLQEALASGKLLAIKNEKAGKEDARMIEAVRRLLDPERLRRAGLELVASGQIVVTEANSYIFLEKAHVDALRALIVGR